MFSSSGFEVRVADVSKFCIALPWLLGLLLTRSGNPPTTNRNMPSKKIAASWPVICSSVL